MLTAIPTLLAISFVIFAILDLAPGDPTGNLPLTIAPEVRQKIRESLGLDDPFLVRYARWMQQFFITEPLNLIEQTTGIRNRQLRRSPAPDLVDERGKPVVELIAERTPQTLKVVGLAYLLSVIFAIPLGVVEAGEAEFSIRSSEYGVFSVGLLGPHILYGAAGNCHL
ncbi:MAG: hypothetical protein R2856_00510 [Caldilineaceae bacterium]